MDFDFFNFTTKRAYFRRVLVPMQRLIRRVLRPMFNRLRDLITFTYHKHLEDRRDINDLQARVAHLEAIIREIDRNNRALLMDQGALIRLVSKLEEEQSVDSLRETHTDPITLGQEPVVKSVRIAS